MKRFFLSVVCVLAATVSAAGTPAADEAYASAKDAYQKLRKDEQRRKLRHHWQNIAHRFEAVAARYSKSDRAPEAVFMAGELNNELSRFSQKSEDIDAAETDYRKLLEAWPKHRLADDAALSLAHLLADREGEPAAARKVLEAALPAANDKKKDITALLASLPSQPVKARAVEVPPVLSKGKEPAKKALAEPAPERSAKREEPAPAKPKAEAPDSAVAQAIRRLSQPLGALELRLPHDELPAAQARRAPPSAHPAVAEDPPRDAPGESDAVGDDSDLASPIASIQEKLRDVRVGARPAVDETRVRSQFKQLVKDEASNDLSLAQQLGLKVRRVVIDAGHGGHDTGAIGPRGTREKDVALAIALKLSAKLQALGLEVVLTRDDDSFVRLEDRTKIANQQKGDLFISVHCNAATSKALRGIETYTLNTSSNRYSIRLAARENATTERGVGDLQYILADLATKANTGESTHLAERVQRSLIRNLSAGYKNVRDLGPKEALFFVLLGAKMPAILVETSFVSNPEEEERLNDTGYQQSVADSIAEALQGFLEERNKVAQID